MSQQKNCKWLLLVTVFVVLLVTSVGGYVIWARREMERGRQSVRRDMAEAQGLVNRIDDLLAAVEFQKSVVSEPTFAAAVAHATPKMADTFGSHSDGTLGLLAWTAKHTLAWSDVVPTKDDRTTVGLVSKNGDIARRKHLCAQGTIASIELSPMIGAPYVGLMGTSEGALYFAAVRDTEDLVALSSGTFCGVVTGKLNNVVHVVGMFDLPGNHK